MVLFALGILVDSLLTLYSSSRHPSKATPKMACAGGFHACRPVPCPCWTNITGGTTIGARQLADGTEIDGAANSTYTLQACDSGKIIKARVAFPDVAGNEESLISVGTLAVVLGGNDGARFEGKLR